jgi:endonuclease/exonuclease/phosphatase family metal-dependent hydrolase
LRLPEIPRYAAATSNGEETMPKIRVMTWNVCGDAQARADLAETVIISESPDILLFQEARKTNPKLSNLYDVISNHVDFKFLFCDEYEMGAIRYGGQNYYPDTKGRCYYCFYRKSKFTRTTDLDLVDYRHYLSPGGKDKDANLLTTRAPAYVELTHNGSNDTVLLFTWHAPLAAVGGAVFNAQAHRFFNTVATNMMQGKVTIIAGDMNATGKQIAKAYDDEFEAAGHRLAHLLTNMTLRNAAWYDDVKSDVHYLFLADVAWD